MITWKKAGTALLVASLISSVLAPAAMAASKKKVGKIYLTIDSDIRTGRDGGDVEVTATGDNTSLYYVDSWEVTNDDGDTWSSSKPPQVDIILGVEDEEEYYFSNTSSSNFKLTLGSSSKYRFDKIKFVNAKRKDSNATLILTVQLVFDKDADTSAAAAPSNLQWDSAHNGNGSWNEVSSAKYYQTQLIKNGAAIGEIKDIYNTSYNFKDQITEPGSYQFKVRSVKSSNSAKSSWNTSGSWTVSEADIAALGNTVTDNSQPAAGTWQTAADGRWWYSNADGSYPVSSWQQIDGRWIDPLLKILIENGKSLECNTGGFKYGLGQPNPCRKILMRYRELGGEMITIGSDAHTPEYVGYAFDTCRELLSDCGYKYFTVYHGRKPEFIPL